MVNTDIIVRSALVDTEKHLIFIDGFRQGIQTVHLIFAAFQPASGAVNGSLDVISGRGIFNAFIKRHCDRGSDVRLNLHTFFGTHKNASAIYVRSELYAFFRNFTELRKRENLETAAIRQNGSVPIKEFVDTAHIVNNVIARTNVEMICVGKLDLTADVVKVLCGNTALNGCGSTNVHKNGRLNRPVNGFESTAARAAFLF